MTAREEALTSLPASREQNRHALAVVLASTVFFLVAAPFAKTPLAPYPAFIPAYQASLVAVDLITAALLFGQLRFFRSRSLLALACGYLFTAAVALAHLLTFPGLLAPSGVLGGGPQTTAWLYMAWHGGFPLFVIAYATLPGEIAPRRTAAKAVACTLALAAVLVAVATVGHDLLPAIMDGHRYTPLMSSVVVSMWLLSFVAVLVLWTRQPHSLLTVWLMVVMAAWIFDIGLAAVLNGGRFDLGFYAGRLYGLLAACLVLLVLVIENGRMYRRLRKKNDALDRARRAALEAEQAKGAFLATMSHEIRTPMSGVMGMLELLSLTRLDNEQRATLDVIRESGRSLLRIVDDILDLSKIEAGKLELRVEPTSIAAIVERAHGIYAGNASGKGLLLTQTIDRRIGVAHRADPLRLGQVLNNLVSNAIKFTSGGSIAIRVELAERRATTDVLAFTVEDTGIGISQDEMARLFQPFEQLGPARPGSSGLGLSICRRLTELMGGELAVESAPGSGTRMRLTLELAREESASSAPRISIPAPPTPTAAKAAHADAKRLLVVDDHPTNLMVLVKQLGSLGYSCITARDGLEALEAWSAGDIGAILTDCDMPEMSGYALARHIRSREARDARPRVPIIACTANAMPGEDARCYSAGMDDYLAKPVALSRLRACLEQWIPRAGPIDRVAIDELFDGDLARAREALLAFSQHAAKDTTALRHAVGAKDLLAVIHSAHRIVGAGRSIGAQALAEASFVVERAGQRNDWDAIQAAMPPLEHELARLQAHLSARELTP